MNRPRLLIADDHRVFAQALGNLLRESFLVLDVVADGQAVVQRAEQLQPDLIVLDMEMPLLNGIDSARRLKQTVPRTHIVFLSMHRDEFLVVEAFRAGAAAYVLKSSPAEEILRAIWQVLKRGTYLDAEFPDSLREFISRRKIKGQDRYPGELTARERQVVQLIAEGHHTKEIAYLLHLACKTVEFHKYNAMKKSHARSTADLTRYALRSRLAGL